MEKRKGKGKMKLTQPSVDQGCLTGSTSCTIADLQHDVLLWYKIRVLVFDLCHISRNPASEARTLGTTDELYISGPYFTPAEALQIKTAIAKPNEMPKWSAAENATDQAEAALPDLPPNITPSPSTTQSMPTATIEETIQGQLSNFLDKRRASGDSRPCGPHDLGPIYRGVFGISQTELEDEKFLARLRRSGLGNLPLDGSEIINNKEVAKKGKKGRKN